GERAGSSAPADQRRCKVPVRWNRAQTPPPAESFFLYPHDAGQCRHFPRRLLLRCRLRRRLHRAELRHERWAYRPEPPRHLRDIPDDGECAGVRGAAFDARRWPVCVATRDDVDLRQRRAGELQMSFSAQYLTETSAIVAKLDTGAIEQIANGLAQVRAGGGRLFILGVGGSAGHASHAVNDFRKICGFEAYAPTDNVSELTARTNDEGWETVFEAWLKGSRINERDALLIFSVGGGAKGRNFSVTPGNQIDVR